MNKQEKGRLGEDAVCKALEQKNHVILARNYRKRCGEIDIISGCDGYVVFTEVKARKSGSMVSGLEAVNQSKREKIVKTADLWMSESGSKLQPRFDIAEVTFAGERPRVVAVNLFENAFTADGVYTVN